MTAPTVHLNGTGADDLAAGYRTAYQALDEAINVVHKATAPHARDYYVQRDPNAASTAQEQHQARIAALLAVRDELLALWTAVEDQQKNRTR